MLNMIRMELYRMFKSKSMYIIWAVMVFMVVVTAVDMKAYMNDLQRQEAYEATEEAQENSAPNIGMTVVVPADTEEEADVFSFLYGNIQGKFIALLIVIFVVIYSMADINSGYIKNIAGQVAKRQNLVIAKVITIFTYVIMTMGLFVAVQLLSNLIVFGYVEMGPAKELLLYMGTQILLHFALALVCMTMAILTRSSLLSMIIAVCLCMNLQVLLYGLLDKLIEKAGVENFMMLKHTLTGKIAMLPMGIKVDDAIQAVTVAVVFGGVAMALGSWVFKKRDI